MNNKNNYYQNKYQFNPVEDPSKYNSDNATFMSPNDYLYQNVDYYNNKNKNDNHSQKSVQTHFKPIEPPMEWNQNYQCNQYNNCNQMNYQNNQKNYEENYCNNKNNYNNNQNNNNYYNNNNQMNQSNQEMNGFKFDFNHEYDFIDEECSSFMSDNSRNYY